MMAAKAIVLFLGLGWTEFVSCRGFKRGLPIEDQGLKLNNEPALQHVLGEHAKYGGAASSGKSYRLPLKSSEYAYYTTIAVGTPPQPFRAAVSLSAALSMGLSVDCPDWTCDPDWHFTYNSSKSSTYVANGTNNTMNFYDGEYGGFLSQDTFHLLGLQIENQTFHEATSLRPTGFDYLWDSYDGVLGLAPPGSKDDQHGVASVLTNLVKQGGLKSKVISFRVPTWEFFWEYAGGEILLGDIDDSHYTGDITYLSLTKESKDPVLSKSWTTAAKSLRFTMPDGKGDLIKEPLDDFVAVVDLAVPAIALPGYLITELIMLLGAEQFPGYEGEFWLVQCDDRKKLPTFTVSLAGKKFTLTPEQYTRETELWSGEVACMLAFSPVENYFATSESRGPGSFTFPSKPAIILGSWFLQYYYTILDMEKSRVGFAKVVPIEEQNTFELDSRRRIVETCLD